MNSTEKILLTSVYVISGIGLALTPLVLKYLPDLGNRRRITEILAICIVVVPLLWIAGTLLDVALIYFAFCALTAVLSAWDKSKLNVGYALGVFAGMLVATTLIWWKKASDGSIALNATEIAVAALIFILIIQLLSQGGFQTSEKSRTTNRIFLWLFLLIAALLSFHTEVFNYATASGLAWHHWGAYIGPAESVLAGSRLFHDIPAQYGTGPTLLVAAACGNNCWNAIYFIVAMTTLAYAYFVWMMVVRIMNNRLTVQSGVLLMIMTVFICFFWTGIPPAAKLVTATPSVSGLRFLPIAAFALALISHSERDNFQGPPKWGHLAWATAALWSPESAFYASFVWWPYFLWTGQQAATKESHAKTLLRHAGILLGVLLLLIAGFLVAYYLIYRTLPLFQAYFAYVLHPPGPIAAEYHGAIVFIVVVFLLGFLELLASYWLNGNSPATRRIFLLLLQCFAVSSYFLGRSHDNNILNILPFQFLVLLAVFQTHVSSKLAKGLTTALLASLLAWGGVFGWEIWIDIVKHGNVVAYKPKRISEGFSYWEPDAVHALNFIRDNFREPTTVLDSSLNLLVYGRRAAWSAIHDPANFIYMPRNLRQQFLIKNTEIMQKSGWVLLMLASKDAEITSQMLKNLQEDFDAAYVRERVFISGNYLAIRYIPKQKAATYSAPK